VTLIYNRKSEEEKLLYGDGVTVWTLAVDKGLHAKEIYVPEWCYTKLMAQQKQREDAAELSD